MIEKIFIQYHSKNINFTYILNENKLTKKITFKILNTKYSREKLKETQMILLKVRSVKVEAMSDLLLHSLVSRTQFKNNFLKTYFLKHI